MRFGKFCRAVLRVVQSMRRLVFMHDHRESLSVCWSGQMSVMAVCGVCGWYHVYGKDLTCVISSCFAVVHVFQINCSRKEA